MKAIKECGRLYFTGGFCGASLLGLNLLLSLANCTASCLAVALGTQQEMMPDSLPILPHLHQV